MQPVLECCGRNAWPWPCVGCLAETGNLNFSRNFCTKIQTVYPKVTEAEAYERQLGAEYATIPTTVKGG